MMIHLITLLQVFTITQGHAGFFDRKTTTASAPAQGAQNNGATQQRMTDEVLATCTEKASNSPQPKSITAVGGVETKGDIASRKKYPAVAVNLQEAPNSKSLISWGTDALLVEGMKGDWLFVRGYAKRPCMSGWVNKSNMR